MSSMPAFSLKIISGVCVVGILSVFSVYFSHQVIFVQYAISPLVIGIVLGVILGNTLKGRYPANWQPGIIFSSKTILRAGIILYGFRITFQTIFDVGIPALFVSLFMVATTFLMGYLIGKRVFKLDHDLSILISAGNAICGAAAILASECMLKADKHKTSIAIGGVVVFGTLSMALYPFMFSTELLGLDERTMGIYLGGSIHEVAHVVAAGKAISEEAANTAVVTKMLRVMLLAPFLLILGFWIKNIAKQQLSKSSGTVIEESEVAFPWFVFAFILVVALNSLVAVPAQLISLLNSTDTFLLTMAMTALGIETRTEKFKGISFKPLYLNAILFIWLIFGGFGATSLAVYATT